MSQMSTSKVIYDGQPMNQGKKLFEQMFDC